jgi:macrophage erythroblast attacher
LPAFIYDLLTISQVPYENYRKVFRTTQKNIERELVPVQTTCNDLAKQVKAGETSLDDAAKTIEGMIGKVENLKRKVCFSNQSISMF